MNKFVARSLHSLAAGALLLLMAPALQGGVNSWTSGSQAAGRVVAADPSHPQVVYSAAYDGTLNGSFDAGRSWTRLFSFASIYTILVHPTTSALYLSGDMDENDHGLFKSVDGGLSWSRLLSGAGAFTSLAASARSPLTLYAGGDSAVYKSQDGGNQWAQPNYLNGRYAEIAALLIDPKSDATLYAATDEYDFPHYAPLAPFFRKSTDSGATWTDLSAGLNGQVGSIAIDPGNPARLFVAQLYSPREVLRSDDGGTTWVPAGAGLHQSGVTSLVMDPHDPRTLYVSTADGVYRTRDSGASWGPVGQQLTSRANWLSIDDSGRFLHVMTDNGTFHLEMASGPVDIASGAGGQSRLLLSQGDAMSVRTLSDDGSSSSTSPEGPFYGWTATAIADGPDGLSRALWQNGDGRVGLSIVGASSSDVIVRYGRRAGWTATDLSVGPDGQTHLLWVSAAHEVEVDTVSPSGELTDRQNFGPYDGWSAQAIADGVNGLTWVLWRHSDGRAGVARLLSGELNAAFHWDTDPGWSAEDVAVGSDRMPRILWTHPDGRMRITTVNPQGELIHDTSYSREGLTARRIATSSDGLTRVLWTAADGTGDVSRFEANNTTSAGGSEPPVAQGSDLTVLVMGWEGGYPEAMLEILDGPQKGWVIQARAHYAFHYLSPATIRVKASAKGFFPKTQSVTVPTSKPLDFTLDSP